MFVSSVFNRSRSGLAKASITQSIFQWCQEKISSHKQQQKLRKVLVLTERVCSKVKHVQQNDTTAFV